MVVFVIPVKDRRIQTRDRVRRDPNSSVAFKTELFTESFPSGFIVTVVVVLVVVSLHYIEKCSV